MAVDVCKTKFTRGVQVFVERMLDDGTWKKLAAQRGGTLNRDAETIDVSSKDGDGWNEFVQGQKSWSVDVDGLVPDSEESFEEMLNIWMMGECLRIRVRYPSGLVYVGQTYITSFPEEFGYQDNVTYSITFEGSGPLEIDRVAPEVAPKSITITPASPTVKVAAKLSLVANVLPAEATDKTVTWTSLTPSIATIDEESGEVTGVAVGNATVIARSNANSGVSKAVTVEVTAP